MKQFILYGIELATSALPIYPVEAIHPVEAIGTVRRYENPLSRLVLLSFRWQLGQDGGLCH